MQMIWIKLRYKLYDHKSSCDVHRIKQYISGIRRTVKTYSVAKDMDKKNVKLLDNKKKKE